MSNLRAITLRFSPAHHRLLVRLSAKLGIRKNDVVRPALTRLAEAERLLPDDKK